MFDIEQLELQIEIIELIELGLSAEEIAGYLENFWIWNFEKDKYGIQ